MLPSSDMLLGLNEPLNMQVEGQTPLSPAQFPVVEHSSLNNTDFAFLDNIFMPEHILPTAVENMADLSSFQGSFFPERNISVDWSSTTNTELDTVFSQPSCLQSAEISNFYSTYPDPSPATCSESIKNQSTYEEISSPLIENESFINDLDDLLTQESICSSNHALSSDQTDVQQGNSSVTSESEEVLIEKIKDDCLAGKKYRQMRQKNNIASQRSRKLRKQKNTEMVDRVKELEIENKELIELVKNMEKERDALQTLLISVISKK